MDEVQLLKKENEELKNKVIELEEKLKKYTAPARSKTYYENCLLYTSPSPRDRQKSRMPSSA